MATIDLNLLPALNALLAEGSVVGAARRLGLSASAMSRTLARLRAATGDPLLVRAGRGLVLTPRAAALRERVRLTAEDALALLRPVDETLDLATLEQTFTIRANDGFVEAFGAALFAAVRTAAPQVRLRFAPKPDKDVGPLREGTIDLEIGVLGESGPEIRVQALFRDRFVGVVRPGHPLCAGEITAERLATFAQVSAGRRSGREGPVNRAFARHGLSRDVAVVVPTFSVALAMAAATDLVAILPLSATPARPDLALRDVRVFELPIATDEIVVSQMWHPRLDADPAHRWLRSKVMEVAKNGRQLDPVSSPSQ